MKEAVAATLILLHAPDGGKVRINPDAVVALHGKRTDKEGGKLFAPGAECLINMADGKGVAVVEPCSVVQKMLEEHK